MVNARPLNICLITQEFPPDTNWGGVGVSFDSLAHGLCELGHRVVVVSRAAPGAPPFRRRDSGVEVWRVGASIHRKVLVGRTVDRVLHARAVAAKVAELDRARPFDVFEGPVAGLDAERLLVDDRFADRTVISCHGSNAMGQQVGGLLALIHRRDWQWSLRREEACLHRARIVVANSQATRRVVLAQGVSPDKLEVVPLGIDTNRFTPGPRSSADPLVVGFAGRLEEVKGIDFVWRVMEALGPDAGIKFRFRGAIHPSTRVQVLAHLSRHRSIAEYQPAGSHDEMPAYFRSIDVLLLPSRFESFGLTYAEAMASGLVVFAGKGGAGPEMVTDGVTGFLVDPDGLVSPVVDRLRTLAADRSSFAEIRRRARQDVCQRVSIAMFARTKQDQYYRVRARHEANQTGRTL